MNASDDRMDMSLEDLIKEQRKPAKVAATVAPGGKGRRRNIKKGSSTQPMQVDDGKKQLVAAVRKRGQANRAQKFAAARGMRMDVDAAGGAPIVQPRTKAVTARGKKAKLSSAMQNRVAAAVARKKAATQQPSKGKKPPTVALANATAKNIKVTIAGGRQTAMPKAATSAGRGGRAGLGGRAARGGRAAGKGGRAAAGKGGRAAAGKGGRGIVKPGIAKPGRGIVKPGQRAANRAIVVVGGRAGGRGGRGRGGRGRMQAQPRTLSARFAGGR
uniref:Uncharacterized protein n=1 Tax=Calcidiscus leptoporus TaxID=127549 RepID=A0A7S0NQ72_9EUKA